MVVDLLLGAGGIVALWAVAGLRVVRQFERGVVFRFGRVRRYRSVGRRRGYVYLYVFEEMPGVYPGADRVDPPTEPALPVVPDVPDGPGPDDELPSRRQVIAAVSEPASRSDRP